MPKIIDVEQFWNANPCGLPKDSCQADQEGIFLQTEEERRLKQDKIPLYAKFALYKDKKVLEIGCGIGTDGIQFARAGALYTGVDLTERGVAISKERFHSFGQCGEFVKANAEMLPFANNSFDHVYSFGVIHHSPHPERIVSEIYRVLKPGGTITIMLYNRTSFYYLIEVKFIRRLFFDFCDKKELCPTFFRIFGKRLCSRFESFRVKLEAMKKQNPHPSAGEWIAMNTDDVFCPIAGVYSEKEARKLFSQFSNFKSEVWFIDKDNWVLWLVCIRFLPAAIVRWLESHFGWFRMSMATKGGESGVKTKGL